MITANALQRVFHISFNGKSATAFMLDIDNRQYMVTAAHVIEDQTSGEIEVEIMQNNSWHPVRVAIVGALPSGADIAVLALPMLLATKELVLPIAEQFGVGQEVYFLGFPHGQYAQLGAMNNYWPTAFVKRGIISAINVGGTPSIVYLDGNNNPGFSGGPVVAVRPGTHDFEVISVVSSYHAVDAEVLQNGIPSQDLAVEVNTGIVETFGVMHAREIARANPIGFLM
jgi:S1-C subfamily serine protease